MDTATALARLRAMAQGVDYRTGEPFGQGHISNDPDTVRALYIAIGALEQQQRRGRAQATRPANTGQPWTEEQDRKLLARWDAGANIADVANEHGRTMSGIRARLLKYGRLAPN